MEISVPAIFPECGRCGLARGVIEFWKEFASHTDFPFCETTVVRVFCFQRPEIGEEGRDCVSMMERAMQTCQCVPDGPFLQVFGGSLSPYPVKCPHFAQPLPT